ncbi:MAG: SMI1/KNR4 family protein [Burkholderiaceae bacterium]|nr:SMI1/KNR4 family protein [Burkholderiaceae bacterium]
MHWSTYLPSLSSEIRLNSPATAENIHACEKVLGITLPEELRSLLSQTDGVMGEYELSLVWPVEQIAKDNIQFRNEVTFAELYMPFDSLLFFADAGNGDQFAYSILSGSVRRNDIFVWNHEDDSRTWIASSLKHFIEGWLSGRIKI